MSFVSKRALQVYPECHAGVPLGIGLSRYKLCQFERAKQAFERVMQASHVTNLEKCTVFMLK